eukprot:scaffold161402_cov30-Tisochrysis_lutea.AAC.9
MARSVCWSVAPAGRARYASAKRQKSPSSAMNSAASSSSGVAAQRAESEISMFLGLSSAAHAALSSSSGNIAHQPT